MLSFAAICPHPPLLIPDIGREDTYRVQNTISAMEDLARDLVRKKIDTILVVSPHGSVFIDFMSVNLAEKLIGDFSEFGSDIKMDLQNDTELARYIKDLSDTNKFPLQTVSEPLDHGTMVPLYFLTKQLDVAKVCQLSFSYLDYGKHFTFGEIIYEAIQNVDRKVAFIASGDLSHRLTPQAPAGFSPRGKDFDKILIESLEKNDVASILDIDSALIEDAGECGLRSIIILLGALSNVNYKFEKMSYEGPFGVGYLVGKFDF
ncbi:MAG: AmmeMemoRadiSam system protein B [Candidatus Pacebacteria bacterium]|nr:AmmeMemoRadiSam system protein B [Candidatus Paceibacterota bacterium]